MWSPGFLSSRTEAAERVIRRFYRDRFMAVDGWVDADGSRWLSLDWRLGE